MTPLSFVVPIKAASTANLREHWAQKHKRTDAQKAATRRQLDKLERPGPLLSVRLTRVAPRPLDDDNLRGALKSVRDAVATWLRVDDRTCLVEWQYAQEKGEPGVRVEVEAMPEPRIRAANDSGWVDAHAAAMDVTARAVAKPRRLSGPTLAQLASSATLRPIARPVCGDCTNGLHEQPWDKRCICVCHLPERKE